MPSYLLWTVSCLVLLFLMAQMMHTLPEWPYILETCKTGSIFQIILRFSSPFRCSVVVRLKPKVWNEKIVEKQENFLFNIIQHIYNINLLFTFLYSLCLLFYFPIYTNLNFTSRSLFLFSFLFSCSNTMCVGYWKLYDIIW